MGLFCKERGRKTSEGRTTTKTTRQKCKTKRYISGWSETQLRLKLLRSKCISNLFKCFRMRLRKKQLECMIFKLKTTLLFLQSSSQKILKMVANVNFKKLTNLGWQEAQLKRL
jgi:hypothetical protein